MPKYILLFVSLIVGATLYAIPHGVWGQVLDEGSIVTVCKHKWLGKVTYRPYSEGCKSWEKEIDNLTKAFGTCPCWTREEVAEVQWDDCIEEVSDTLFRRTQLFFATNHATTERGDGLAPQCTSDEFGNVAKRSLTDSEWRGCTKILLDVIAEQELICVAP